MVSFSKETISEIKSRVNLVDLVLSYGVDLRQTGSTYKAHCPFHDEKTPSFHVDASKGRFKCFGCGEYGDAISFVMKKDGLSYQEAICKLAGECGVSIEARKDEGRDYDLNKLLQFHSTIADFFHKCLLNSSAGEKARNYLSSRSIPIEAVDDFNIGYVPNNLDSILTWASKNGYSKKDLEEAGIIIPPNKEHGSWYSIFSDRLVFPIKDKLGRVVGFSGRILREDGKAAKYINSYETPIFKKRKLLFAFDRATAAISKDKTKKLIVCEGQIDVIRCHINGIDSAVASLGTSFTIEQAELLKHVSDSVIIAYDGDLAGIKAAIRTGKIFLQAGLFVSIAKLPEGQDPDSFIRDNGVDAFKDCVFNASSIVKFYLEDYKERFVNVNPAEYVYNAAQSTMEIISTCPNAVLKSALIADVSQFLNIPVAAIEADLSRDYHTMENSRGKACLLNECNETSFSYIRSLEWALCGLLLECEESDSIVVLQEINEGLDWSAIESNEVKSFIKTWMAFINNGERQNKLESCHFASAILRNGTNSTIHPFKQDSEVSFISRLKDIIRRLKIAKNLGITKKLI